MLTNAIIVVPILWLLWGALHSALVSARCKQWARAQGLSDAGYRRAYNAIALVSIMPVAWMTWTLGRTSPVVLELPGMLATGPWLARALALAIFIDTLRVYNAREFAGIEAPDEGVGARPGFSFTHRFVRHPWYFALLLVLWVRPLTVVDLMTSIALTIYLIVGATLEERRLDERFGKIWRNYVELVPMLLPSVFRRASVDQLATLRRL